MLRNKRNINHTYLNPSSHPSPPVPDVLPNASNSSTLLIKLIVETNIHLSINHSPNSNQTEKYIQHGLNYLSDFKGF